jgi:hypothetical protein
MDSDFRKQEYYWPHHWTADSTLNLLTNFDLSRNGFCQHLSGFVAGKALVGQINA